MGIYPWQEAQWEQVRKRVHQGNLPHALMLNGPKGLGKANFANTLAQRLLCIDPVDNDFACQHCRGCELYGAGSHPDFRFVAPEGDSRQIKIDQIREMIYFMGFRPQIAETKIAIISNAHLLNRNAANSLLKTLEEPPAASNIILVCENPAVLPATVRSRCQHLLFSVPSLEISKIWLGGQTTHGDISALLSCAQGAPLAALVLAEDDALAQRNEVFSDLQGMLAGQVNLLQFAERLEKQDFNTLVTWVQDWLIALIRLSYGLTATGLDNQDFYQELIGLRDKTNLELLFRLLDKLYGLKRNLQIPLNKRLIIEDMLISCKTAIASLRAT